MIHKIEIILSFYNLCEDSYQYFGMLFIENLFYYASSEKEKEKRKQNKKEWESFEI